MEKALAYTPIVYNQATYQISERDKGFNYTIEYKQTQFPEDCLLYLDPAYSSQEISDASPQEHTLTIKLPKINEEDGTISYAEKFTYPIVVETISDNLPFRPATSGDIIANRMCVFRFKKGFNKVILINSPLFNDARYSSIRATNAEFLEKPVIVTTDSNNNEHRTMVATSEEVSALDERLTEWENKINFGTKDPEEALQDAPVGSIYIQLEED